MNEEYGRRLEVHAKALDRWREHKFASLNSPTCEANFDPNLFLAKYFLDDISGAPAPHKTKDPLTLQAVNDRSELSKAVQSIAGLKVHFAWRTAIIGWENQMERAIEAEFLKLDSPTMEANFDLDRFLAKYFLDDLKGKPARSKMATPITLFPWLEHGDLLEEAVSLIPGLHVMNASVEYLEMTLVGWDPDKLHSQVLQLRSEAAEKAAIQAAEARAERDRDWQKILQPHHEYVRRHQVLHGPLRLEDLTGSYIVRCDTLERRYMHNEVMTLDIAKPDCALGTKAAFHFGFVKGTMLLAMSDDSLEMLRREEEVKSDEDIDHEIDLHGSRKRKAKDSIPASRPIKRKLGGTPQANRISLQWAGGKQVNVLSNQIPTTRILAILTSKSRNFLLMESSLTLRILTKVPNSQFSRLQTSLRKPQSLGQLSVKSSTTTNAERDGAVEPTKCTVKSSFKAVFDVDADPAVDKFHKSVSDRCTPYGPTPVISTAWYKFHAHATMLMAWATSRPL